MDAFVSMRKYLSNNLLEQKYINNMVLENRNMIIDNSNNIKLLKESFSKLGEKRKDNEIYFILDDEYVYHSCASINRIGYKTFSITKIGDDVICRKIIDKISEMVHERSNYDNI